MGSIGSVGGVIRAAGVVLLRPSEGGPEFLTVHRPYRADWSLPKGKVDPGEHVIAAAVRECDEESGFTPILGSPLPTQQYSVDSTPKVVHYWRASIGDDEGFAPDDEVDQIRWLPVAEAPRTLTYAGEASLVERAAALPNTVPLVILRHTQALKRADFDGKDDSQRPLSGRGRSQSRELLPLLSAFGVSTVHSSPARRCEETVRRFAKQARTAIHAEPHLSEEGHEANPKATAKRAATLARKNRPIVVCSHRPVLPTLLAGIGQALGLDEPSEAWARIWDPKLPPGGFLVVHRSFEDEGTVRVVGLERHTLATA